MPPINVVFFKDITGVILILDWLDNQVSIRDKRAAMKCRYVLNLLRTQGNQLRRPHVDYLRDGIYELRAHFGGVHYRILYFFSNLGIAVVSHGITKLDKVPDKEIDLALAHKALFDSDPERYSHGS